MHTPGNYPSFGSRAILHEPQTVSTFATANFALNMNRNSRYEAAPSPRKPISSVIRLPVESEDACITGTTRSLSRRLLALNLRTAS